jgi:predicted double-glycine peptidase
MIHFFIHLVVALFAITFAFLMRNKAEDNRKYKITAYAISIVCVIVIAIKGIFVFCPALEAKIMPTSWYYLIDRNFPFLFFIVFLSVASTIGKGREQKVIYALLAIFSIYTIHMPIWRLSTPACYSFKGELKDNVCMQTSGYTCGAASMVTLLNNINIKSTEGEMAELSGTIPYKGVSNFQVLHGMNMKFKKAKQPYATELKVYSDEDLTKIQTPFLVTLKHAFFCDHMVCVLEISDKEVLLGDPLTGRRTITHQEFLNKWKNVIVEIKLKKEKQARPLATSPVP